MERVEHLLLLLVIIAAVEVLRLILLIHVGSFHSLPRLLPMHLHLHLSHMGVLMTMDLCTSQAILQILTHTHHSNVVASWRINSRALIASLKLVETTRSALRLVVPIGNVPTLKRLLRVDTGQRSWLLRLRISAAR